MFQILTLPNQILREHAKEIDTADRNIKELAGQMLDFLRHGRQGRSMGVGLAAPQIGQSAKIIVVYSKPSRKYLALLNPQVLWHSKRTRIGVPGSKNPFEGCLSVPGFWGKVRRPCLVKVLYQTPTGAKVIKKFRGFTAVVVQHEIDHLEGILFIDRIREQGGKLYRLVKDKTGKEKLVPYNFYNDYKS
jgi:peptide deformylase